MKPDPTTLGFCGGRQGERVSSYSTSAAYNDSESPIRLPSEAPAAVGDLITYTNLEGERIDPLLIRLEIHTCW